MEIILLLTALAATPFGAAILTDKPTQKRLAKFIDVHWLQPLEQKARPKSLAPSIIPAEYGKLEPKDRNEKANTKLAELWQDAFDWLSIPDAVGELREAQRISTVRDERTAVARESLERVQYRKKKSGGYSAYVSLEYRAEENLREAVREAVREHPMTPTQARVYGLSKKYGWELIDNDLIRLAQKPKMPTFDYIALTSV